MKLSSKALACGQSPMRKFHPYAVAAAAAGKKIYHLNIGQPDIHTPDALYDGSIVSARRCWPMRPRPAFRS